MTASDARQITAEANKTTIRGIYEEIRIAANEGQSSIVFQGNRIVKKSVIEQLESGNEDEKFLLKRLYIPDLEMYNLVSIHW